MGWGSSGGESRFGLAAKGWPAGGRDVRNKTMSKRLCGKARFKALRKTPLFATFMATGLGFTIPGAAMPLLLLRWSMTDARGGILLFCFYGLGIFGAYSARGRMHFSLARGSLLTALGACCLIGASRWEAYAAIALYGFGLALTMTSISLLVSQQFPMQRRVELMRLNLVWALGAAMGPWIALQSTGWGPIHPLARSHLSAAAQALALSSSSLHHLQHVLLGVALFFLLAALWAIGIKVNPEPASSTASGAPSPSQPAQILPAPRLRGRLGVPWTLLALIFGATGIEAAASGWLTSYAQRAGDSLGATIGAATFLWLGSLLSRILHSTTWVSRLSERAVLGSSVLTMAASLALLLAWPAGFVTLLAAGVLGLATGPVYPLLLAIVLRRKESSLAFTIAALGSSLLPLATGGVSTWAHSLRAGLGMPLLTALAMVLLVAASRRTLQGRPGEVAAMLLG